MKNKIILILIVFIVILAVSIYAVFNYRRNVMESQKINIEFEKYYQKQVTGHELISIINKAIDVNTKNAVEKDGNGLYIENDDNSIKIYIKFKLDDEYSTVQMEKVTDRGTDSFLKLYNTQNFECTEIEYHKKTNNVKSVTFTET